MVDDYYKQGKAINQTLARDQLASDLGLHALVTVDAASQSIVMQVSSRDGQFEFPDAIRLQLIHATRSELDHQVWLRRSGDGSWRSAFAVPADARWQVQIDDGAGRWRLLKAVTSFAGPISIGSGPPRADANPRALRGS